MNVKIIDGRRPVEKCCDLYISSNFRTVVCIRPIRDCIGPNPNLVLDPEASLFLIS